MKNTFTDKQMDFIADETERILKKIGIFYLREGTVFNLTKEDMPFLFASQAEATKIAISKGVVTQEDLTKQAKEFEK